MKKVSSQKDGFKAWSPSRYSEWESCAFRAYCKHILRIPEGAKGDALVRGEEIHHGAEDFITGRKKELHPDLKKVKALITKLRTEYKKDRVRVELELAFDRTWKRVEWFAKDAWCRFKLDVLYRPAKGGAEVKDWKTGKYKPDGEYDDQLNCYAIAALSAFPELKKATGQLVFTDHGPKPVERPAGTLTREELRGAQEKWEKRVKPMFEDRTFAPHPSDSCRWCPYSRNRSGPCKF